MKKFIYLSILFTTIVFGQNPEIKTDLPTVIPPSPTVAALMKFEEVPVSNYTGIPDVSIPLFSSPTHSKDIGINIALKYHSGVGADDRASDVGLGWSLFAGGSISRTVRGLPDEILTTSSMDETKIGLYHTSGSIPSNINNYYYFKQNIATATQDYFQPNLSTQSTNIGNEFLWTAANANKYDTEHDLWQFNFMGNSGRFYIKKNLTTNLLEIVPLDDYRVKIVNNYGTTGNNPYIPMSFTIYDEKGYKYIFDVVENSENKSASASTYCVNQEGYVYTYSSNVQADKLFKSSFHLSKVYDTNNKLLVDFIFNPEVYKESFSNFSSNTTNIDRYQMGDLNKCGDFPPLESTSTSTTVVDVKKIQVIDIIGYSKIYFEYIKGRLDTNINIKEQTAYLNSITIKDINSNFIKKFNFEFSYSTVLNTRMILKRVKEYDNNQQFILNSEFFYKQNQTNGKIIGKDYWGFFNLINACELTTINHKNPSIEFCTSDLLEKIKYSTGGYVKFEFEPNTYSYSGSQEIIDFEENENNFHLSTTSTLTFNNSIQKTLPVSTIENRKVKFYPSITVGDPNQDDTRTFSLLKKVNGNWTQVFGFACPYTNGGCCIDYVLKKNQEYAIKRINLDINYSGTDSVTIEYFNKNSFST